MPQGRKKAYTSPSLKSFDNPDEVLAWAASRGTSGQRKQVAELADEMRRIRLSFSPRSAQRNVGR